MARDGMARDGLSLAHTARIAVTGVALLFLSGALGMAQSQQEPAKQEATKPAKASKKKAAAKGEPSEKDEAGKKVDPAEVQKTLDTAQKSLDAGKFDAAGAQAGGLISKGGLDSRSMARALAIRGHAHKKQGKPAQAIADLQSALWLKGGLSDAERASAAQARVEAYREAGLGEPPAIGANKGKAVDTKTAAQETSRPIATAAVTPRATEPAQPAASGGGNFFSNLFGQKPPAQPVAQAATAPAAPVNAAVSSWTDTTTNAPAKKAQTEAAAPPKPKATQVASAAPVAAAAGVTAAKQTAAKSTSQITLQLAAVGSKAQAEAIAQRVKQDYGAQIGQRKYAINESAFGGGTFYRVQIGPFTDQMESQTLCASLRGKGIDCMLVSN